MKKRLLCLLLGMLMLMSVLLAGCSNADEEGADVSKDTGAQTITMRLISEKKVCNTDEELAEYLADVCGGDKDSQAYKDMLDTMEAYEAVEAAFSKITKSKYKTNVDLLFYTEDEYYDMLKVTMEEYALEEKKAGLAQRALEKYISDYLAVYPGYPESALVNEFYKYYPEYEEYRDFFLNEDDEDANNASDDVYQKNDLGIKELVYPEAAANQLDIIYVSGYDMYQEYIENEWIASLNEYISSTGRKLGYYITPALMNGVKVDGSTYAIPNNVQMGEYTYMLVDKELADKYKYTAESFSNLIDCKYFIEDIVSSEPEVLPIDSTFQECMDLFVWYWNVENQAVDGVTNYVVNTDNSFSLLGTVYDDISKIGRGQMILEFDNLFTNESYREIYLCLKKYEFDNCYVTENDGREHAAISFVKGTYDIKKIAGDNDGVYVDENGKEYYAYVAKYPIADEESLYGNMFAISANSKSIQSGMEVLTLLNTDPEIRNILQYGIEGVNYGIDEDTGILYRINDDYMMDIRKTGNCFIAHPEEGYPADYWEIVKIQSNETLVNPLLDFDFDVQLAEYGSRLDDGEINDLYVYSQQKLAELEACMDYEELESLVENLGVSMNQDIIEFTTINANGNEIKASLRVDKLINHAYDVSTGLDGEADENGESPYTVYYNWLKAYGFIPAE